MKTLNMLLSVGAAVMMSCGAFALENNTFSYRIANGEVIITGRSPLAASVTEFEIPETIDDLPVTQIDDGAFLGDSLEEIDLGPVRKLGARAFKGCTSLESVNFGYHIAEIPSECFSGCSALSDVVIAWSSVTNIADRAFYGCNGITQMMWPSSLRTIGTEAFRGCSSVWYICAFVDTAPTVGANAFSGMENSPFGMIVMEGSMAWDGTPGSTALPQTWKGLPIHHFHDVEEMGGQPYNDKPSGDPVLLFGDKGTIHCDTAYATRDAQDFDGEYLDIGKTLWYAWEAMDDGVFRIASSAGFETVVAIYDLKGNRLAQGVGACSTMCAKGAFYKFVVGGRDDAGGPVTLTWSGKNTTGLVINGQDVAPDSTGTGWTSQAGNVRLTGGGYVLSGNVEREDFTLIVMGTSTVTLSNLTISAYTPFSVTAPSVNLVLAGKNRLEALTRAMPGLHLGGSCKLTIDGIKGASLEAIGNYGIGGWSSSDSPTLTVNGGLIRASAARANGNGAFVAIGGASCQNGSVTVNGGTVEAVWGDAIQKIAFEHYSSGIHPLVVGGGSVKADINRVHGPFGPASAGSPLLTQVVFTGLPKDGSEAFAVGFEQLKESGYTYGTKGVVPDSDGQVYFWFPHQKSTPYAGGLANIWYENIQFAEDATRVTMSPSTRTAKAVIKSDGVLRFVFDKVNYDNDSSYMCYSVSKPDADSTQNPLWLTTFNFCTKVIFDKSFADFRPRRCAGWFDSLRGVTEITGLENLNVSRAENLSNMFRYCSRLKTLDLTGFDTSSVTNMHGMFLACSELTTIRVSSLFTTAKVLDGGNMFAACPKLVGGKNTVYDENNIGLTYARIDGGSSCPGYFTGEDPLVTYTVTLGKNGGTGSVGSVVVSYGNPMPTIAVPVKTDYKFDGYWTTVNPGGVQYYKADGTSARNWDKKSGATLWAKWTYAPKTYTVTLGRNGGTGGSGSVTATYGQVMPTIEVPTKTGYVFEGYWTTTGTGGVKYYNADGSSARNWDRSANATLWAKWTELVPEAKAVVAEMGTELWFVYDAESYGTKDKVWFSIKDAESVNPLQDNMKWKGLGATVTRVVFDASFKACKPKHCGKWFFGFGALTSIQGIENLDTSAATSLAYMFSGCSKMMKLDLSNFNTANVTDTSSMFSGCGSLSMINVSEKFTTAKVTSSANMFQGCTCLVGGSQTKYDKTKTDKTYARIDGGTSCPGYFTGKNGSATYKITLGKNGGTGGDNYVTVAYGETPHDVKVPVKTGSTFGGYWTTCSENGVQYFSALGKGLKPYDKKANISVWAKWWNTITFGKNGGTGGDDKVTVVYGQVPHRITPPTKKGYVFDGYWTTTGAGGVQYYTADGQGAKMWTSEKNATHYAKWVAGTGYKVTFGLNGGTGGAYVYAAKGLAMPKITPPTKAGYTFAGYWTTVNAGGVQYYKADGTSAKNYDKNAATTLYAKWTKNASCLKASAEAHIVSAVAVPKPESVVLAGLLADGTGSYTLLVDEDGETGFVSVELFDGGTFVAEVAIETVDDEIVLVTEDGESVLLAR